MRILKCKCVLDPDPPEQHVFGPPESGSTSESYGSGSGTFYHHAKIVKKNLESYYFVTFDFLSLKMMIMYVKKVIS